MKKTYTMSLIAAAVVGFAAFSYASVDGFKKLSSNLGIAFEREASTIQIVDAHNTQSNPSATFAPEYSWEGTDTVAYFVVAKSHTEGYSFKPEGGDLLTYDLGVLKGEETITLTNLFNVYDPENTWMGIHEYPIEGSYDATANTLTIETPKADVIKNYYSYTLKAGQFDENGNLIENVPLVFNVGEDFSILTATTPFGADYDYGWTKRFKEFTAYKKDESSAAKLISFATSIDFGQAYPGDEITKDWTIVNAGGTDAEYVLKIDSENGEYKCSAMSGTIAAYSTTTISFTFAPAEVGESEGLVTMTVEGCDPVMLQFAGEAVAMPDYSAIVKNGDFTFSTNIEYPAQVMEWEHPIYEDGVETGEKEKVTVAKLGTQGTAGTSSLMAKFNVPEGKLGKLSFKGHFYNYDGMANWYKVNGNILVDDDNYYKVQYTSTTDFAPEYTYYEFAPGDHYLYIVHNNVQYTGYDDATYVWDLDLQYEDAQADLATLDTPEVNLNNMLLDAGATTNAYGNLTLTNKGLNPLTVTSVTADSEELEVTAPTTAAAMMESLSIPVTLKATTAGEKNINVTIATSAGEFKALVKANVIARPDYSTIFTAGADLVNFTYNEQFPFIIEDGKAYNITSKQEDAVYTYSNFGFNFTVPEGKIARISWEAHAWGTPEAEYTAGVTSTDYAQINISQPMAGTFAAVYDNDVDFSSKTWEDDEYKADMLVCPPGYNSVEFTYTQGGDKRYFGEDRLEVSNISVVFEDVQELGVELLTPEVEFTPVYVGPQRYSVATVAIRNTGTTALSLVEIPQAGEFYGIVPENQFPIQFNKKMDVELWFYPSKEGAFEDDLTIVTSSGEVKVHCKGETKSMEGILYPGDFEDDAYGWGIYDYNNDYSTWNLGTNLWGERETYVHSGIQCLGSVSYDLSAGATTPDDITVSPAITVPEDGGKLTYYIASFSPDDYAEHYSFYIVEDASTVEAVLANAPVLEETIDQPATQEETNGYVDGWMYREFDLADYAGKTIYLAFRHHDCTGQYILRLDDVFAYDSSSDVKGITAEGLGYGIARQEIYDINGTRLTELQNGLNIVRTIYENGSSRSSKVIVRK